MILWENPMSKSNGELLEIKRKNDLLNHQQKSLDSVVNLSKKLLGKKKIVGLSFNALFAVTFLCLLTMTYSMYQQMNLLKSQLYEMKTHQQSVSKLVIELNNDKPRGISSSEIDHKLSLLKNELAYEISQLSPKKNQWAAPEGGVSVFDRFNGIDLDKYLVNNLDSFTDYGRYLTEASRLERELRTHINEIITHYAKNHQITSNHRSEYLRVLEFRDRLAHDFRDRKNNQKQKWKQRQSRKRSFSSL